VLSINDIAAWGVTHPWATADQIEQDLLLSRAICAIADHDYLSHELIFRGGTALHKLCLPNPQRYSEDLDYVRSTEGGIGILTGALLDLGRELGFDVLTAFRTYRPEGYTTKLAISNLQAKLDSPDFRHDVDQLTVQSSTPYDPDQAAEVVTTLLLQRI